MNLHEHDDRQELLPLDGIDFGATTDRERSIVARFRAFHEENPHVADRLAAMALDLLAKGWRRQSIKMHYEVLRAQYMADHTPDEAGFRLNNDYTALYARLLVHLHPELDGVFEMRRVQEAA